MKPKESCDRQICADIIGAFFPTLRVRRPRRNRFGFADLDKKVPADSTTVYRVGSVTKLFTALMLMQLRDAGKLKLDDPIEKYLPEFKIKSQFPDARPATFRQVAAHYSGLPIEPPMAIEYENPEKFPPVAEQLKSLKDVE